MVSVYISPITIASYSVGPRNPHVLAQRSLRRVERCQTYPNIRQIRPRIQRLQQSPTHRPTRTPRNSRIRTRLIIPTPTKHKHTLPLMFPILHEMFLSQPFLLRFLIPMLQSLKKRLRPRKELFCVVDFAVGEAALEELARSGHEVETLFHVIHQIHISIRVGAVHIW